MRHDSLPRLFQAQSISIDQINLHHEGEESKGLCRTVLLTERPRNSGTALHPLAMLLVPASSCTAGATFPGGLEILRRGSAKRHQGSGRARVINERDRQDVSWPARPGRIDAGTGCTRGLPPFLEGPGSAARCQGADVQCWGVAVEPCAKGAPPFEKFVRTHVQRSEQNAHRRVRLPPPEGVQEPFLGGMSARRSRELVVEAEDEGTERLR